jgi:uncharacterized protein
MKDSGAMAGWTDASTWLGRWPFLGESAATADELAYEAARCGVERMLVSPLDALLNVIPSFANERARASIARESALVFVPVVNPSLPGWHPPDRELEARCIRIAPGYHHYELTEEICRGLAGFAHRKALLVQVVVRMEDERNQSPLLNVVQPRLESLSLLARTLTPLPVLVHNLTIAEMAEVGRNAPTAYFDIAYAESFSTMESILEVIAPDRVVFGSNFPIFTFDAAAAKVESWHAERVDKSAVRGGNLQRAFDEAQDVRDRGQAGNSGDQSR